MTKASFIFKPTLVIGAGGSGRDAAHLFRRLRSERIVALIGSSAESARRVTGWVETFTPDVYLDSDRWEAFELEKRFADEEAVAFVPPASFEPLASPSGKAIIESVNTPPYRTFKDWENLPHIANKASDSEAQGNRLYGLTNAMVNARPILRQLSEALKTLDATEKNTALLELRAAGLMVETGKRVHIFSSVCGGQGAGLLVFILGCLAKMIEARRFEFEVNLHLFMPGFHRAQDDARQRDQVRRALSVLRDLHALRGGSAIELRLPDGSWQLKALNTEELYNHAFVHLPCATATDAYKSFVVRVAHTVIESEMGAIAADLRRQRSNAKEQASGSGDENIDALGVNYDETLQQLSTATSGLN
ncbi:MAG: Tubulin like [Blastocatellia bacterium]|jgi:hypothetical protein|nr:Tubulin like [Blastocatellia bacterium]